MAKRQGAGFGNGSRCTTPPSTAAGSSGGDCHQPVHPAMLGAAPDRKSNCSAEASSGLEPPGQSRPSSHYLEIHSQKARLKQLYGHSTSNRKSASVERRLRELSGRLTANPKLLRPEVQFWEQVWLLQSARHMLKHPGVGQSPMASILDLFSCG